MSYSKKFRRFKTKHTSGSKSSSKYAPTYYDYSYDIDEDIDSKRVTRYEPQKFEDRSSRTGYGVEHDHTMYVGSHGGYGMKDKEKECCPLVVDPLPLFALLSLLAGATFLLNTVLTMTLGAPPPADPGATLRMRRSATSVQEILADVIQSGGKNIVELT